MIFVKLEKLVLAASKDGKYCLVQLWFFGEDVKLCIIAHVNYVIFCWHNQILTVIKVGAPLLVNELLLDTVWYSIDICNATKYQGIYLCTWKRDVMPSFVMLAHLLDQDGINQTSFWTLIKVRRLLSAIAKRALQNKHKYLEATIFTTAILCTE